ncbi:MAG: hypothetical protein V1857_03415 [archaeon]
MDPTTALLLGAPTFFFMIAFWSITIRENPLYRLAEHIYIGLAVGNYFVMSLLFLKDNTAPAISRGMYSYIVPLILGTLLFATLSKKVSYMSRWGSAMILGSGTALAIQGQISADLIANARATMMVIAEFSLRGINSVLVPIMLVAALSYFIYTMEKRPLLGEGWLPKIGRLVLMTTFGARYANGLMSRVGVAYPMLRDNVIYYILRVLGLMPW